ncbi:MAG: hypothetical protein WDA09_02330 [Bacteriovoracaceae bacterium]
MNKKEEFAKKECLILRKRLSETGEYKYDAIRNLYKKGLLSHNTYNQAKEMVAILEIK